MKTEKKTAEPSLSISKFVRNLPLCLFEHLEDGVGPLLPSHHRVAMVLETVRIEECIREDRRCVGRPRSSEKALARAFVAKAVLNVPTTKDLVERLGLDFRLRRVVGFVDGVPSESTFSRAFASFALSGIADEAHEQATKALLENEIVFHASVDTSAIPARERGMRPEPIPVEPKKGRGRKRGHKNGVRLKPPSPQEKQLSQTPEQAALELSQSCDHGLKRGPKGYMQHWRGYKAHASVGDDGIPLAFLTTSASVNDSLGAIPLLRMTVKRAGAVLYGLMDKAYFGEVIAQAADQLGLVAIVPPKKTKKKEPSKQLDPCRQERYRNRTNVERFFSDLKENHGGNHLYVKGGNKAHTHLMMGVLAIFGLRALGI